MTFTFSVLFCLFPHLHAYTPCLMEKNFMLILAGSQMWNMVWKCRLENESFLDEVERRLCLLSLSFYDPRGKRQFEFSFSRPLQHTPSTSLDSDHNLLSQRQFLQKSSSKRMRLISGLSFGFVTYMELHFFSLVDGLSKSISALEDMWACSLEWFFTQGAYSEVLRSYWIN